MRKTADSRRRAGTELAKQGGTISSTPILLARLMEAHCFSRSVRLKQEAALSEKIADAVRSGHTNYQRSQGGVWGMRRRGTVFVIQLLLQQPSGGRIAHLYLAALNEHKRETMHLCF